MNELIEFLTSQEIIVVYIVAAVACFLGFIIYIVDKNYYKRKQRHNTKELNKLVEEVNEIIEEEYAAEEPKEIYNTPVLETIEQPTYAAKTNEIVLETENKEAVTLQPTIEPAVEEEIIEQLEIDEEPILVERKDLSNVEEISVKEELEEELTYTTIEPNQQQAQEELLRLTEELEKAEQEQKNIDLTAYEEEQEENAIISLEELMRKSKEMYEANEITQYEDEGNEPISLEDLERRMNKIQEETKQLEETPISITATEEIQEPIITQIFDINEVIPEQEQLQETPKQMVLDDFNTVKIEPETLEEKPALSLKNAYQATKKFERSPVISPIYGIERKETTAELELENTANYEKLDEEIKKTNEFLMTLRELQKNLD